MSSVVVDMRGISKAYAGVPAVDHVDFAVRSGESVGLVGKNGAGKSTLIKILAGLVQRDAGTIAVDGGTTEISHPYEALRLGLSFLHQDLNDVPTLSVAENIWLGSSLPKRIGVVVDRRAAHARAAEVLELVGAQARPSDAMYTLSAAQRQLVMLARSVLHSARVLVMDEPTASLSDSEIEHLRSVLAVVRKRGTSIVFVSHRLGEVLEFCDRVVVMRDARVVDDRPTEALRHGELVSLITGEIEGTAMGPRLQTRPQVSAPGEEVLRVDGIGRADVVQDVSFTLRRGEVLGVGGLVGSGRTELARLLFGADRADSGRIELRGRAAAIDSPRRAIRAGITLLPEDRRHVGVVGAFTVRENLTLPTLRADRIVGWLPVPSRRREGRRADDMVRRLGIVTQGLEQPVVRLSGGNQQKVVLGKWLLGDAEVLIFDEPTHGVDVGAKEDVYAEVAALAAEGKAVIFISSELEELERVASRVIVLREGRLVGELEGADVNEARILELCYGHGGAE